MPPVVGGEADVAVAARPQSILRHDDRRRLGVGGQRRVKPPADAARVQDEPRADDARPGTLREVLGSGALLQLPCRLLELFVRHLELRPAVVPREPQPIAIARPIVVSGAHAASDPSLVKLSVTGGSR